MIRMFSFVKYLFIERGLIEKIFFNNGGDVLVITRGEREGEINLTPREITYLSVNTNSKRIFKNYTISIKSKKGNFYMRENNFPEDFTEKIILFLGNVGVRHIWIRTLMFHCIYIFSLVLVGSLLVLFPGFFCGSLVSIAYIFFAVSLFYSVSIVVEYFIFKKRLTIIERV